ncbi:MAG: Cof-type HAD-IIB family hydrolase [Erysipelotrichaceae bacterium]|nr:Cof-type HAD-IIB family hydrolase [Erysipelotrichaceae bacterium]
MKPMLCFDVDGTLRDNVKHEVRPLTLKALQQLKENGYHLIISSGRGIDSLKRTGLMELFPWDGYVLNNGQVILDENGDILFSGHMKDEAVRETLRVAKEVDLAVVLKAKTRVISKEPDAYVLESQRFFNNVIPEVGEYYGQDVDAMIIYGPNGYDYAPFLHIDGINVLPGESTYADVTIKGLSKATGIHVLMDKYGDKEYWAFGDSMNDYEMFKHADFSIAMGQGNAKLKAIASYVTDPIDEDGLYKACIHLNMIGGNNE